MIYQKRKKTFKIFKFDKNPLRWVYVLDDAFLSYSRLTIDEPYFPLSIFDVWSSAWKDQGWEEGISKEISMIDILQMILEENH